MAGTGTSQDATRVAAGIDGMTVEQVAEVPEAALANHSGTTARGTYQPQPVKRVEIPKAGRRHATTRHPDGAGSLHPAGGAAGSASAVGTRRSQSTATASGPDGSAIKPWPKPRQYIAAGLRLGRGHRSGEVLRSGEPRHADGRGWHSGSATSGCSNSSGRSSTPG